MKTDTAVILASKSPQRKALLEALGIEFDVLLPDYEEEDLPGESPADLVERHSRGKANSVFSHLSAKFSGSAVLGVDTMVVIDGKALGKASDEHEALDFLKRLSGRAHLVYSGLTLLWAGDASGVIKEKTAHAVTEVRFRPVAEFELESYVATGEWRGRAGAYAIQGRASAFVEAIDGDYTNVVGLPVPLLVDMLREWGQWPPQGWSTGR
ncbi:MAG: Maf family protein [Thermoleophilia bacterium]